MDKTKLGCAFSPPESRTSSLLPENKFTPDRRSDGNDDARWWNQNAAAVVIKGPASIAAYRNTSDDIVIRQRDGAGCWCGDPFVVVPRKDLARILAALFRLAKPEA